MAVQETPGSSLTREKGPASITVASTTISTRRCTAGGRSCASRRTAVMTLLSVKSVRVAGRHDLRRGGRVRYDDGGRRTASRGPLAELENRPGERAPFCPLPIEPSDRYHGRVPEDPWNQCQRSRADGMVLDDVEVAPDRIEPGEIEAVRLVGPSTPATKRGLSGVA